MKMNERMRKTVSILLCALMLTQYVPTMAFAVTTDNLCDHHSEHTADCGYVASEGSPCTYDCQEGHGTELTEQEGEPVCTCGTDDPAIHATNCAVYVAPEDPQCFCTEKCTEPNVWCDVCGFDVAKCAGTDTAAAYEVTLPENPTLALKINGAWVVDQFGQPGDDAQSGAGWSFDASTSTLTLTNANLAGGEYTVPISWNGGNLTIVLNGTNTLGANSSGNVFYNSNQSASGTLTITGSGSLTCSGELYSSSSNMAFNITNTTITATGISPYGNLTIDGSTVTGDGAEWAGVYAGGTMTITNSTVVAKSNKTGSGGHGIQSAGNLTITGSTVTASGSSNGITSNGNISISGSRVEAAGGTNDIKRYGDETIYTNSIILTDAGADVYGEVLLTADLTINADQTLNIPEGASLTIAEGVTLTIAEGGTKDVQGTLTCQKHNMVDNTCTNCGLTCGNEEKPHTWENGSCTVCGAIHKHASTDWTYAKGTAENTLTATCVCKVGATITLNPPTTNPTYDGTTEHKATVTVNPEGVLTAPTIRYSKDDLVSAGEITAFITMGEGEQAVTASVSYTVAKATITPTVSLAGWTYGGDANEPAVSGNPGNGEVSYQYTVKGENSYSATVPTDAGDYTVKATVAESANYLGGEATADFTIAKAKIKSISDAPGNYKLKQYHTTASSAAAEMQELKSTVTYSTKSGDIVVAIEWSCADYNSAPNATNTFHWSVKDGELKNYDPNGNAIEEDVTVTNVDAVSVTHTGADAETTYNGKTYDVAQMFTKGTTTGEAAYEIVSGGTGAGELNGSDLTITKAGTIKIKMTTAANGAYAAGEATATLTVKPVSETVTVTITENSGSVKYDGTEQSVIGYAVSISNNLYTEKDFTFSGDATIKGTDAGTYNMELKPEDFTNNSVNFANVEFVIVDGTLEISKREVTLTSADDTKVYDGTALTNSTVSVTGDGWADGEGASYSVTGTITDKGEVTNAFTYTLNDGTKADNYTITKKEGKLSVTPVTDKVTVTITENSDTVTYDGTERTVTGYTVSIDNDLYTEDDFSFSGNATVKGTDAGSYDMSLTADDFTNKSGNFTNVEFVIVDGTLTVKPVSEKITVTITENSGTVTYNGAEQSVSGYAVSIDNPMYMESYFTFSGDATAKGTDKGTYSMELKPEDFTNNSGNFTNVVFTIVDGSLTINAKAVTVTPDDQEITYGESISQTEVSAPGMAAGHRVTATLTPSTNNVTVSGTITAKDAKITDGNGNDVTANYEMCLSA